jgi:hypothetical protein
LLPFGRLDYRLLVLPIIPQSDGYELIDSADARNRGFLSLARWMKKAEKEWETRRGTKAEGMTIYQRIDRFHCLTRQNPQAKYRVIYNTSGSFLTGAVVKNRPIRFKISGQRIAANAFVANDKTYYYELDSEKEAFFLATTLNAPVIDKLIKPMQSRGLCGPRDIHKKALELPIPKFNVSDDAHLRLVELGADCSMKVDRWLASGGAGEIQSIGKLRGLVREMLKEELKDIDEVVKKIIE